MDRDCQLAVEAVHRQTEGNPLFVTEVVRLLGQEGDLVQDSGGRDSWSVRIPEGVREVIGRRLDRLSERCNETLTIASVIGREFTLEQLSPLIEDIGPDRLLDVMEEALSARVIEELPRTVGRYQFTHALIQETLSGELSTTRKVRMHARIAETLEELYGDDVEAHAGELAFHFAEAQTVLVTDKLVRYSLLAGERALSAYAWEDALAHFGRGLATKGVVSGGTGPVPDAEAADLLFGLGRALAATAQRHQINDVLSNLAHAFDYYIEAGDVSRAVEVAECPLPNFMGRLEGAPERVAHALKLVPPDSHQAGRLLSRYSRLIGTEKNDYVSAQEAFEQALFIARREGDTALEMQVLADFANVAYLQLQSEEGLKHSLEAIALARQASDPFAEVHARTVAGTCYLKVGDAGQSHLHLSAALEVAERLHDRFWLGHCLFRSQELAILLGDWPTARAFGHRGLLSDETDPRILGTSARLEYEVGNFDLGVTYLVRLVGPGDQPPSQLPLITNYEAAMMIPIADRITGNAPRLEFAESAARAILSSRNAVPLFRSGASLGLGLIASKRADARLAADQYESLQPYRNTMAGTCISFDRVLGLVAHTIGDLDLATTHFEDGLAFCRKAGYRPELAWTCCDYADLLLERNIEGDQAKAASLLDESLAISSELGMRPLMERVLSRREILKA